MKITRWEYIDDLAGSSLSREKFDSILKSQNISYDLGEYDDYSYAVLNGFKGSKKDFNNQGDSKYVTKILGGTDKKVKQLQEKINDLDKIKSKLEEISSKVLSAVNNEINNIKDSQKEYNNKTIQNLGKKADKDHKHKAMEIIGLEPIIKSIEDKIEDRPTRDEVSEVLDKKFITKDNTYSKEETRKIVDDKFKKIVIPGNGGGSSGGSGDVTGPASSTDNAIARFDSTTGKSIQNSTVTIDDDGNTSGVNSLGFDTTPTTHTLLEGELMWNTTDGTLDLGMNGGDIKLQIGQENFIKVRNSTGSTIDNGTVVYFNGSLGNRPTIAKARSDVSGTSMIQGLLTQDIVNNADGFITTSGYVRQIKTNYTGSGMWGTTWVEGDLLYVSKTDAGVLTNIQPSAPHHSDIVGTVGVIGAAGTGSILVNIDRHKTLEDLSDVNGTALTTTGQIPVWDQTGGYFDFTSNINDKLDKNTAITGATKTKITYDADGLVTAGADATTADIADSTNKRYVTDEQLTVIGNTSGENTGDVTLEGTPDYLTIVGQVITRALINLTSHVTGTLPVANGGTGVTSSTGTGNNVLSNSPTLVTPILGTPTSGTLTNCTGLPVSGIASSTASPLGVGTIELGHATDTTISRSSAGVIAVEGVVLPTISSTNTLTNKTIALGSNTVSGTKAQFDTACTDDNFAFLGQAQSFTATQTFANVTIGGTTNTLTVNGQNRTSGWTSWTPTIGATGGGSASGVSVINAIYKKIGRIMFISGRLSFNKNTLSGSIYMSLPEVDSAFICSINAWIGEQGSTGATLNGGRTQMEATGSVYFENGFGTSYIQASDLTSGTQQVRFNGFYQTAS